MMMDSVQLARKYQIRLPKDLILFYRSLATLEHICRRLDPNFTFIQFGSRFSKLLIRRKFTVESISKDFLRMVDGLRSLSSDLPLQLKHLLTKLEENSLFPQLTGIEKALERYEQSQLALSASVIFSGMLIGASITSAVSPQSWLVWVLWPLALAFGGYALSLFRRR
jgi:ubiquinone biosynthesis protein